MAASTKEARPFVVVGGGVAAVSCVQQLCKLLDVSHKVVMVCAGDDLKVSSLGARITEHLHDISVESHPALAFQHQMPNQQRQRFTLVRGAAVSVDVVSRTLSVKTSHGVELLHYHKLAVCTGAAPLVIAHSPHVLALRDTESVEALAGRLRTARRVMLVGNGGIALELVHALRDCALQVIWSLKGIIPTCACMARGEADHRWIRWLHREHVL